MISILTRRFIRPQSVSATRRYLGNGHVPFNDDLTAGDLDDFGLGDFHHYQESPEVAAHRLKALHHEAATSTLPKQEDAPDLEEYASLKEPVVFVSKLSNPYVNLAMEDYIYNKMPLPEQNSISNYNRLMFYTNSPCVVIGKNQNPWQEVNLPLLNSLQIPLIRRRSGGGTVVHDMGNVNFSFMTTKENFDRFTFSNLVVKAVNSTEDAKYNLEVNERGDITTTALEDGINYKVSGSAYKLSKGRSYHHGTMLLDLKLDVLRKVLSRDQTKLGFVNAMSSIPSVRSKVTNLELSSETFINLVSERFQQVYGIEPEIEKNDDEYDQNELFGLTDFVEANSSKTSRFIVIDEDTKLPEEIHKLSGELKEWSWKYGATPKFTHLLVSDKLGFLVKFHVDRHAILSKVEVEFEERVARDISKDAIIGSFEYLQQYINDNKLTYTGSNVAGFITNDLISDWVGSSIDGTT